MSALKNQPDAYPWRMEFGTVNTMGVAGLFAAQKWIAGRGGVGAHAFTLRVHDGTNTAPVFVDPQAQRMEAYLNVPYVFPVQAVDAEGDQILFALDGSGTTGG